MSQNIPKSVGSDGMLSAIGGMDSGKVPSLINPDQYANGINVTARNGFLQTRPGWILRNIQWQQASAQSTFETGNPQALGYYQSGSSNYLIANIDGRQFAVDIVNGFRAQEVTPSGTTNPKDIPKTYMSQWGEYYVIQDGQSPPIYLKGLSATRTSGLKGEIPVGTAMAFGWGRGWVANGREFVAGDIQGGDTNVVTFSAQDFLNEGGAFQLPANMGLINGMAFIPLQDTATGQGQLLIGADFGVGSVNGGIPRALWKDTQIQQVALLDVGWVGQDSIALLNGDIFYRSYDGIRSYRMARAQQGFNGNTPQSNEVQYFTSTDTQQFLKYGSGVYFDGRILMTTDPVWRGTYCYHRGLLVLDSQPQSNISSKSPPAWDGMWDGLNIVQITKGIFNKQERCFALVRKIDDTSYGAVGLVTGLTIVVQDFAQFTTDQNIFIQNSGSYKVTSVNPGVSTITLVGLNVIAPILQGSAISGGEYNEIWELSQDSPFDIAGNEMRRIKSKVWTRSFTHQNPFGYKELSHGMMWVDSVIGTVDWSIKYRPDQYPCMVSWKSGQVCSEDEVCNEQCPTNQNRHPGYNPAIIFSAPQQNCSLSTQLPSNKGYEFQWLIEWEGHMRIRAIKEICIDAIEPVLGNC